MGEPKVRAEKPRMSFQNSKFNRGAPAYRNPHPQFEEDWINFRHRISHSKMGVSRIWPKTQPPPNDTLVFGEFLSRNTSKYSEILQA